MGEGKEGGVGWGREEESLSAVYVGGNGCSVLGEDVGGGGFRGRSAGCFSP